MPLKALAKDLREQVRPLYLFSGAAHTLVQEAMDATVKAVLPRIGLPAFNHASFRADEGGTMGAIAAARTLPMMAERRLVVLRGVHEATPDALAALWDYAQSPSETTTLVLTSAPFAKPTKGQTDWAKELSAAVRKAAGSVLVLDERSVSPDVYAMARARDAGKELGKDAARNLVAAVGPDLAAVAQEVDKLVAYVGDAAEIGADAVLESTALLGEAEVWALTASLAARDRDRALAALHRLLEQGEATRRLLAMVQWQLRPILEVAEMKARGCSEAEMLGAQPNLRREWSRIAPALDDVAAPHVVLRRLARLNQAMNSHRAGDRHLLEAFVLEWVA